MGITSSGLSQLKRSVGRVLLVHFIGESQIVLYSFYHVNADA